METNLSVCLLNDSFPPLIDGVANAVLNYADIIEKNYGHAMVLTPEYPNVTDNYPFEVVRYPSIDTTGLVGYRAGMPLSVPVIMRAQNNKPDIIHSHCPIASTFLARTLRSVTGAPIIFTYHTKFDIDINNAIKSKILRKQAIEAIVANIECCDEVWTVSRGAGENLKKLGFRGDYVVMKNGVDMPKGRAPQQNVNALAQKYNINTNAPVFLFAGRLMWYKGIKIIIDALKILKEKNIPFTMVFVGNGGNKEEIESYTAQSGIGENVLFTGAVYDREELREWYCLADLFLFPSTFDTNGIVVREAAACGLASILIKDSCAAEDVEDGKNGFLIEENAQSLAQTLVMLNENKSKMAEVGQNAMDELYFSWEQSVAEAVKQYEVVIKRNAVMPPKSLLTIEEALAKSKANEALQNISEEYRQAVSKIHEKFNKIL